MDFTEFQRGKTYEIYNKKAVDVTFSVTGKSSGPDISHSIISGDNFISPAVKTATNVSTVLGSLVLGTHYSDVKRFNATSQTWESYQAGAFTQFEPGKGYNIVGLTNASFSYGNTQQTTTMVYDSTGSRVKKTSGSTTTIYLGKDYEVESSSSTKYIFLGDRRISTKKSDGTIHFIHSDHINSSNIITDSTGNQAALLEYDPYGETVTQTGSADPKHKYTGQERDDSSHLYYYNARYYDPQIGRFITADPTVSEPENPQEFNRYTYAGNNPIKYNDPTGLKKKKGGFWKFLKKFLRIARKIYAANIALGVAFATYVITGDPHLAAGAGGATYRGLDAILGGASPAEAARAAARGYYEGVALANGDRGAAISIIVGNPETGSITQGEIGRGARQGQSALSQLMGIAIAEAAVVATLIEGTTAVNSAGAEISESATVTNQVHLAIDRFSAGQAAAGPRGLGSLPSHGAITLPFHGEGVPSVSGGLPALAVDLARINSGGIELRGGGSGNKRPWFERLFGRGGPLHWLNHNRWFRFGPGDHGPHTFFRIAGKVVDSLTGKKDSHIDFDWIWKRPRG